MKVRKEIFEMLKDGGNHICSIGACVGQKVVVENEETKEKIDCYVHQKGGFFTGTTSIVIFKKEHHEAN